MVEFGIMVACIAIAYQLGNVHFRLQDISFWTRANSIKDIIDRCGDSHSLVYVVDYLRSKGYQVSVGKTTVAMSKIEHGD